MSKNLMFGKGKENPGWAAYNLISTGDVDNLELLEKTTIGNKEPGKISAIPKTAIPSPFARFALVKKAFLNVANQKDASSVDDQILVSHALDVLQFVYEGHPGCTVEMWNIDEAVDRLMNHPDNKNGHNGHKTLGEVIQLYRDQESMGFSEMDSVCILLKDGDPVGCTSPTSLFMATPDFNGFQELLKLGGDRSMFVGRVMLWERDEDFVRYVYRLAKFFNLDSISSLSEFNEYLKKQKDILNDKKRDLYSEINQLGQVNEENMESEYIQSDFNLFGKSFYMRKPEDLVKNIEQDSAFVMAGAKNGKKPLVLTNYKADNYSGWNYTSKTTPYYHSQHKIDYVNRQSNLPGTDIEYEWLCELDFLSDVLIRLPYPLDTEHFFDGNITKVNGAYYLPPIKSKYFEYFDYTTIFDPNGTNAKHGSRNNLEIEEVYKGKDLDSVLVRLQIPVNNGKTVTLARSYTPGEFGGLGSSGKASCIGTLVDAPIMFSIFPFVRLSEQNFYNIQVAKSEFGWDGYNVKPEAYADGKLVNWKQEENRTDTTSYYSIKSHFDYLIVKVTDNVRTYESVVIPQWGKTYRGSKQFNVSFDFGTSNSHIEIKDVADDRYLPLTIDKLIVSSLDFSKSKEKEYEDSSLVITDFENAMKQEFLPQRLGSEYLFPMRTVVVNNKRFDISSLSPNALVQMNIPFVYGKEDYNPNDNMLTGNIKWPQGGGDVEEGQRRANAFIEELVLLARAFVIEHDGDLKKTNFVWTYPLSMRVANVGKLHKAWQGFYMDYFDETYDSSADSSRVTKVSESVAPLLYHRNLERNMTLLIDIGGGTCDVVIRTGQSNQDTNRDEVKITSFRFAADVIFGAGTAESNSMVRKYYDRFSKSDFFNTSRHPEVTLLRSVFDKSCTGSNPAAEANSMLFAIEGNRLLDAVKEGDKSYNYRLSDDEDFKLIFIYFYAAILYYLTKLMKSLGFTEPRNILFSGNGSKLLKIIGDNSTLTTLTSKLLLLFSDNEFCYTDGPALKLTIESKIPKQLTAMGALNRTHPLFEQFDTQEEVKDATVRFSMATNDDNSSHVLKYADLKDDKYLSQIADSVKDFNAKFIDAFTKLNFEDSYSCSSESLNKFRTCIGEQDVLGAIKCVQDDENYRNVMNDKEKSVTTDFEDVLFFYPIKSLIYKLLTK